MRGPSAWIVPVVTIFISRSIDSAFSRLASCTITRASRAVSRRSSPITSMPPFSPERLTSPLTIGTVVLRSSQTRSWWPENQLLFVLPSSPVHGVVVKVWARSLAEKSRARKHPRTNLRIAISR